MNELDYDAAVAATLNPSPEAVALMHFISTTTEETRQQIADARRDAPCDAQDGEG